MTSFPFFILWDRWVVAVKPQVACLLDRYSFSETCVKQFLWIFPWDVSFASNYHFTRSLSASWSDWLCDWIDVELYFVRFPHTGSLWRQPYLNIRWNGLSWVGSYFLGYGDYFWRKRMDLQRGTEARLSTFVLLWGWGWWPEEYLHIIISAFSYWQILLVNVHIYELHYNFFIFSIFIYRISEAVGKLPRYALAQADPSPRGWRIHHLGQKHEKRDRS